MRAAFVVSFGNMNSFGGLLASFDNVLFGGIFATASSASAIVFGAAFVELLVFFAGAIFTAQDYGFAGMSIVFLTM